ncbi:hypothetical protein Salat_2637500 [Sesamum alatum]|uniref:Uncharacterized protein n=1 Tax=Sesamum alatum TaxID=300844 RepID=A0AAE1XPQ0_9LAMI|nr:hypothetical protein Salat_2637500 [Sesamum alatum]
MDSIAISFQEEEEEEEALSLCDFPLNNSDAQHEDSSKNQDRHDSSSQPSDFFEFFKVVHSDVNMSHAEDIISCGRLIVSYKQQPRFDRRILTSPSADEHPMSSSRRYCESLPDQLNPTRSNGRSSSARLISRNSRSLDCKKLRRNSSLVIRKSDGQDIHRSFSKGSMKSEGFKGSKPRWCPLMFGLVKFPPEMDLRDMKSRQVRRSPGSMFPAVEGGDRIPASRRTSWGGDLLRVLSCKKHASVAVTASIGLVSQV